MPSISRYRGALLGLAAGDALGTALEFTRRGTFTPIDEMGGRLWAFHQSDTFREGALLAVNLGEDAGTTGAAYGQLAGAYYGVDAVAVEWRARLSRAGDVESLATALFEHAHASRSADGLQFLRLMPGPGRNARKNLETGPTPLWKSGGICGE